MVTTQLSISINALPAVTQARQISGALRDMSKISDGASASLGVLDKQFARFGKLVGPVKSNREINPSKVQQKKCPLSHQPQTDRVSED